MRLQALVRQKEKELADMKAVSLRDRGPAPAPSPRCHSHGLCRPCVPR